MTLAKLTLCSALFLAVLFGSGCGYLDDDLWVDDETFEEELSFEGMSISGSGHGWGCGGGRVYRRRLPRIRLGRMSTRAYQFEGFARDQYLSGLTDQQILEYTDVETLEDDTVVAGTVEEAYYETKAERDAAIVQYYVEAEGP